MNLPPALLNQLQSEEQLEEVMAQATIITAPQARGAVAGQVMTIAEAAQAGSDEVQVVLRQQNKRKAAE
jgi:hypothetical protein